MRRGAAGWGEQIYERVTEGGYCNASSYNLYSCINAISRYEKRKDEAAQDLQTCTHMRNGEQLHEPALRETGRGGSRAT